MKIVKFKDGRYGVRKWRLQFLGYVFYFVRDHSEDLFIGNNLRGFWSYLSEASEKGIKHETHDSALKLYKAITAKDNYEKSLKDTGTPMKEQI
jgi:hypothetical protein